MEFRDIVKLVHPDVNPNIPDAGKKMGQCVYYKKDPKMLQQLAIKWGLVAKPAQKPPVPRQTGGGWSTGTVVKGTTSTRPRPVPPRNVIQPNTVYCNGTEGWHKRYQRWFPLDKTTPKMVYYWDATLQKQRKCSLKTMTIFRKAGAK